MRFKTLTRKKKITLSALLAVLLVLCGVCVVFFLQNQKRTLFFFKPSSVKSITLWCGDGGSMEITNREQIDEIIRLLNDFTYKETKELPPMGGWSYQLDFSADGEVFDIDFDVSIIREWRDDGSSVIYYGPAGHFQTLVDLAEEAHANFSPDE